MTLSIKAGRTEGSGKGSCERCEKEECNHERSNNARL